MVQVYAKEQGSNATTELDVVQASIEMNFQIQDISDLTVVQAPHSNTFQLPFSRTNNVFFEHYYEANIVTGRFSIYAETIAEVLNEGRIVISGILQLMEVDTTNRTYRCVILASTASLFEKIRGKNWADFFRGDNINPYTDLDHALTAQNIIDSWTLTNDITLGAVGDGVIVYPMTDNALSVYNEDEESQWWGYTAAAPAGTTYTGVFANGIRQMFPYQFRPSIQVKWLLKEIVSRSGFTIESNFMNSAEFSKLYMILGTEAERVIGRNTYSAKVGQVSNLTITPQEEFLNAFLPSNESTPFFDPDNHFLSGVFVAPFNGVFQFIWSMEVTTAPAAGTYSFVGVVQTLQQVLTYEESYDKGTTEQFFRHFWVTLSTGQEVRFYTNVYGVASATINANANTYVQLINYSSGGVGIVDVIANFPKVSVDAWVKSILTKFNLVVAPAPKESVNIKMEPWPDFIAVADKTKDWTSRLNWDATMLIKPTTEYQKKTLIFTDAEGNDWRNEDFQRQNLEVYGTYRYENLNEFATGDQTIGGDFVPHQLSLLRRQEPFQYLPQFRWHQLFSYNDGDDQPATGKPILAFYHGTVITRWDLYLDGISTGVHPFFSMYSDGIADEDSWSLAWHPHPFQFWAYGTATDQGCYRKFWAQYVNELYSEDCRILECEMVLTPEDIRNLEWSDAIWVMDSYWRVVSISGWNVSGDRPCKVTMVKVLDKGQYDCDVIIDRFNADGTIDFVDTEGDPIAGTAKCCVRYGYTWNSEVNECFWRIPGGATDHENPTPVPTDTDPIPGTEPPYPFEGQETITHTGNTGDVPVSISSFQLTVMTTDATPTEAVGLKAGVTHLAQEGIYSMRVAVMATEVGGTSGTIGHTHYQEYMGTVQAIDNVTRTVGQHMIAEVKSTGGGAKSMAIGIVGGYPPTLKFTCTGASNVNVWWVLDVTLYRISTIKRMLPAIVDEGDALWENNDEILFENSVFMNWE